MNLEEVQVLVHPPAPIASELLLAAADDDLLCRRRRRRRARRNLEKSLG